MKNNAFTLAEILIVLVIIGVLTMILLPVAFQSSPDEKVMKFKKAHNTLLTAVKELVSSDEYYQNGDLGLRADGKLLDGTHKGDIVYFCNTLSSVMNVKEANCSDFDKTSSTDVNYFVDIYDGYDEYGDGSAAEHFDEVCKGSGNIKDLQIPYIISSDGVVFYEKSFTSPFGAVIASAETYLCIGENACDDNRVFLARHNGFLMNYKTFCIDIDDVDKGEDGFGYGIRVDGKVMLGNRAKEWLEKSIQKKN